MRALVFATTRSCLLLSALPNVAPQLHEPPFPGARSAELCGGLVVPHSLGGGRASPPDFPSCSSPTQPLIRKRIGADSMNFHSGQSEPCDEIKSGAPPKMTAPSQFRKELYKSRPQTRSRLGLAPCDWCRRRGGSLCCWRRTRRTGRSLLRHDCLNCFLDSWRLSHSTCDWS